MKQDLKEKIAMAMLLDAEWFPPWGTLPGYFKTKDGQYFTADGEQCVAPWLIGLKKNGTE
jgi:hypothetical protein